MPVQNQSDNSNTRSDGVLPEDAAAVHVPEHGDAAPIVSVDAKESHEVVEGVKVVVVEEVVFARENRGGSAQHGGVVVVVEEEAAEEENQGVAEEDFLLENGARPTASLQARPDGGSGRDDRASSDSGLTSLNTKAPPQGTSRWREWERRGSEQRLRADVI